MEVFYLQQQPALNKGMDNDIFRVCFFVCSTLFISNITLINSNI